MKKEQSNLSKFEGQILKVNFTSKICGGAAAGDGEPTRKDKNDKQVSCDTGGEERELIDGTYITMPGDWIYNDGCDG
ncbi:MAG: hypothetical protein AB8G11_03475 [Saprospiraceae bacterium]